MLIFNNKRVTHIYKGTELVDEVKWGKDIVFPYSSEDKYLDNILHTELGYSAKYIRMLEKAGLDLDTIDVNLVDDSKSILNYELYNTDWSQIQQVGGNSWYTVYMPPMNYYIQSMYSSTSTTRLADIVAIDMSNAQISHDTGYSNRDCTSFQYMFKNWKGLLAVDLSTLEYTLNVTNMAYMFSNCTSLKYVDLGGAFNTSNVTTMLYMFLNCSSLEEIDLSSFDTSKVTNMSSMFYGCSSLKSVKLSNYSPYNIYTVSSMFYNCSALTSIDFGALSFNGQGSSINNMFYNCNSLNYIRCTASTKVWLLNNATAIKLPTAMQAGGEGVWDIIDETSDEQTENDLE